MHDPIAEALDELRGLYVLARTYSSREAYPPATIAECAGLRKLILEEKGRDERQVQAARQRLVEAWPDVPSAWLGVDAAGRVWVEPLDDGTARVIDEGPAPEPLDAALREMEGEAAKRRMLPEKREPIPADEPLLDPEARAIMFVSEHVKSTGRLPTKTAIARQLDCDRRTLNNWRGFKVAYARLRARLNRPLPRGTADGKGGIEAWRE